MMTIHGHINLPAEALHPWQSMVRDDTQRSSLNMGYVSRLH